MVRGVIKTQDILCHPIAVIALVGFRGFLKILWKALGSQECQFINFIEISKTKIRADQCP